MELYVRPEMDAAQRELVLSRWYRRPVKGTATAPPGKMAGGVGRPGERVPHQEDEDYVNAAQRKGLRVTGTLGILDLAAQRGLAEFAQAVEQLRQTNFRVPRALLDSLLEKHKGKE